LWKTERRIKVDKKEKVKNFISLITGLVILVPLVYLLVKFVIGVASFFKDIDWFMVNPTILAAAITATVGMVASVLVVVIGNNMSKRREVEFQNRSKKSEAYATFVQDIVDALADDIADDEKQKLYIRIAKEFGRNVILWGSDNTIKAYAKFRDTAKTNPNDKQIIFNLENVLYSIRKDLGHKNKNLNKGTLLSLFLIESSSDLKKQ